MNYYVASGIVRTCIYILANASEHDNMTSLHDNIRTTEVPQDMDYLIHLIDEMECHVWETIANDARREGRSPETELRYLAHFSQAWKALKKLHRSHSNNVLYVCNICPSEDEDILNAMEDTVKRLDNDSMECILHDIMNFIQNNKNCIEVNFFNQQWKHAVDMFTFWKGLRDLSLTMSLSSLHRRAIGFPMRF
jgi:hypothetical protein